MVLDCHKLLIATCGSLNDNRLMNLNTWSPVLVGWGWVRWQRGLLWGLRASPYLQVLLCSVLMVKDVLSQHPCFQPPHRDGCLSPEPNNPSKPSFCKLPCSRCFFSAERSKVTSTLHWVRQLGSDNEPAQLLGLKRLRKKSNSCNLKQYGIMSLPSCAGDLTAAMTLTQSTRSTCRLAEEEPQLLGLTSCSPSARN